MYDKIGNFSGLIKITESGGNIILFKKQNNVIKKINVVCKDGGFAAGAAVDYRYADDIYYAGEDCCYILDNGKIYHS